MHSVYKAINKPMLIMGIPKPVFMAGLGIALVTFNIWKSLPYALVTGVVICIGGKVAIRKDDRFISIWWHRRKLGNHYEPVE